MSEPINNGVVNEFVSAVRDLVSNKAEDKRYLTGTVSHTDHDGTVWVNVAGGVSAMPVVRSTASYSPGDLVSFSIENGVASMGGNVTDPAAGGDTVVHVTKQVDVIENHVEKIEQVKADKVETDELKASVAHIDAALIGKADIDDLTAANARIEELQAADATITGQLTAANADIANLKAKDVTIEGNLSAATGRITMLESTKADISVLESDYITADDIEATYMRANMSNSDVAWIKNGVIANGAISSAMINDVSANKLTAGTINGSVINVTNLNADNITTGTINGQRIGEGSLSLGKLSEDVYTEAEVDAMLDTMQAEIDGAIETWTGTEVPTLNNAPASAWTTTADRDKHVGDVYFNTTSGYNYRFTKSGTGSSATYSWLQIKDTDITNALQRIQTAEGQITQFDSDISTLKTDTGELKTKTQSLETSLGDKVDTTTFNELSSTVDENSATITTHSTVLSNNGLTSSTNITNTVNTVSQTASGNSSKISQLTTTLGTNADGTSAANDVMHRMFDVEQDLDGITTRVAKTEAHIAGDFALSTTGASTTAKTATITPAVTGWTLEKGVSVTVRFDNENTVAAPTLNVNSTGAKAIRDYAGNALAESAYKWKAGTAYSFTYDGTYWRLQDSLLTSRVTQAESAITQQADQIEAKVSKDGVIAAINLSTEQSGGSAAKISADKVNIEGAAIFTSGRLSQTSLNNAYDQNGAASTAVDNLASDLASATGTTVIHGGHIITNTIDADRLNAVDINASGTLTVGAINLNDADTIAAISNEGRSRNFYLEPTYILTVDTTVNAEKNYYTRSVNEDGGYDYTIVENPVDSGLSSYYERISGTPTPPYSIGDTWTPGEGGSIMVCIEAKEAAEEYDVADWVPADGTSDTLAELSAGIAQARADLTADIARTNTDLSDEIGQTSDALTERMNASDDRMDSLEAGVANASAWRNYMHFDEDTGLTIGQLGGDYSQVMDATGTHWRYGGEDAASVEVDEDGKGAMMLARSEVTEQMRVGNYVWFNRGNRLSLRYLPKGA